MVSGQVRKRQEMGTQMGTQARSTLGMSNVTVQGDTATGLLTCSECGKPLVAGESNSSYCPDWLTDTAPSRHGFQRGFQRLR
jgi:hypothetical protein